MKIGYFLASEEHPPQELLRQAQLAEDAGFEALWISDHFHPWTTEQGQASFVWSVLGGLSQATRLPVTTAVVCPILRMHPVVVAQAAATCAVMLDGRFVLGVGTGEHLNEHVVGDGWPAADVRMEMLEEAIEVIRKLHSGEFVRHRGVYYDADNARVFTLPDRPIPIYVAALGPRASNLAARAGDGLISVRPDATVVRRFHDAADVRKPVQGGLKVCWAESEEMGVAMAQRLWAADLLPGNLAREIRAIGDFEAASSLITEAAVREAIPCGPDVETHMQAVRRFAEAGFDELYIQQIGPDQDAFFAFAAGELLPRLRAELGDASGQEPLADKRS